MFDMSTGQVLLVVAVLIVIYIIVFTIMVAMREAREMMQKQIDVQADRRYKVFESLISAVKQVMDFEKPHQKTWLH